MSIDPKFIELTAEVCGRFFSKYIYDPRALERIPYPRVTDAAGPVWWAHIKPYIKCLSRAV